MLASRSQLHAICVAATVTLLMSGMLPEAPSKGWRRAGAHDLAFLAPGIAEAMRNGTLEVIRIAHAEQPRFTADGELDLALDDDTPLFAGMRQHLLAGIGVRRVAFVQDRHAALPQSAADETQLHGARPDVRECLPRKEDLGLALEIESKEIGQR